MGGHNNLRYALIGLAPYLLHYDHSKTPDNQSKLLQYFIAFDDLHNFYIPTEDYRKCFRKEYLLARLPINQFDLNNPFNVKTPLRFITAENRLKARERIDTWGERYFPETRAENIKILDDYLTLCEDNNIRPIMFMPPMTYGYKKYFNKQRIDELYYFIQEALKKHSSAVFVDAWKLQGLTDADFYDVDHLNIMGAAKFSMFLNDFIERLDK